MKNTSIFWLVFVCVFGIGKSAFAQGGISVEPVFQNIAFEAETERADFLVTLVNNTATSLRLRPSVVDFGSLDESGGVAFLGAADNLERKYGLASWMRPEKDSIFLDPGESESLRVVIENRDSLSPGGHYGAVLFQMSSDEAFPGEVTAVAVQQSISVLVFAQKKGGERYDLQLKGKEWLNNPFVAPSSLRLRFQNSGNVHVVPRGLVTLTDSLGRTVAKGAINPESSLILPETQRLYVTALRAVSLALLPGYYTFEIAYRFDGQEDFRTEEVKMLLFPWQGAVILLVGVMVLWVGRVLMNRWAKKKKNEV